MSMMTRAIGLAKKVKHELQDQIAARTPVYLSPVRRIERVALRERVAAMTFDDGPFALPANPGADDRPLTLHLLETLEKYGAKGTFDIVGDTSGNYPDEAGEEGTVFWGGKAYDHYPDFGQDEHGGAAHCPELVQRILDGGHEITSHTWRHVLYGHKRLVYGKRQPLCDMDKVLEDLKTMDEHMKRGYGYSIRLSRPPHYVDNITKGLTAYDAYGIMGYQYLAASFDGAGWLPLPTYQQEVEAIWKPMEARLAADPDYFCGQIIFHKDGYNMARRTPVADGLERQLELLTAKGYRVVTVSELLELCPFRDVGPGDSLFPAAQKLLQKGLCICYRDNTLRPAQPLTRGELAMMLCGWAGVSEKIRLCRERKSPFRDVSWKHPYAGAIAKAVESGLLKADGGSFAPNRAVSSRELAEAAACLGYPIDPPTEPLTHGSAIEALAAGM